MTGFVYNDLKPNNVMLRLFKDSPMQIYLIDFGLATRYLDEETNKHLQNELQDNFKGNIMTASLSCLQFNLPTRKDDLLSLCYLLIMFLNGGSLPFLGHL